MRLSKNFSTEELSASGKAKRMGISNTPDLAVALRLHALCKHVLQPLRDAVGVIEVTSGYRCKELNVAVGGAATSQHTLGEAADIKAVDTRAAFEHIRLHLDFDQLIWEYGTDEQPDWIHVSYRVGDNRHEVLRKRKGAKGYESIIN